MPRHHRIGWSQTSDQPTRDVHCSTCDFKWTGPAEEGDAVLERHRKIELPTCAKAEKLFAEARKGDWKIELDYITGPTEYGYADGSTRIVTEDRAVVMIQDGYNDRLGFVLGWTLSDRTGRWKLMDATMLFEGGEYNITIRDIESFLSFPDYRDWSEHHKMDATNRPWTEEEIAIYFYDGSEEEEE